MKSRSSIPMTHRRRTAGFSFTEVLFAVMILGIGFIMVAAIFPVAIQQTQNTTSEGNAAAIARGAVATMQQTLQNVDMPETAAPPPTPPPPPAPPPAGERGRVFSLRNPQQSPKGKKYRWLEQVPGWTDPDQLWNRTKGNLIVPNDPRFGWVGFYKREYGSPYVQVFVVATQTRVRSVYEPAKDLVPMGGNGPLAPLANLQARPVTVSANSGGITFSPPAFAAAVAEGCYVIIASSNLSPGSPPNLARVGWMNGRIYRVGNRFGGDTWDYMPGNEFRPDPGPDGSTGNVVPGDTADDITELIDADAFVVGRSLVNSGGTALFEGPAQDVAVYTTFVQLR